MTERRCRTAAIAARLGCLVLLVACGCSQQIEQDARAQAPAPLSPGARLENERNTIDVFRRVAPSVVNITNSRLQRQRFSLNVMEIPQGSGSGFLWDESGHVVTNYHVLQNGDAFSVTLEDGTSYDARVVGWDASKDLAVLEIQVDADAEPLPPVELGESKNLLVGQKVLAIGNPFGLDHTLTTGVISALGREIKTFGGRTIRDVVQTDASINPGNSGGPLLDSAGRLIGVNTAIVSPSGQSAGIGFAVPVNTVKRVVPQLIRYGRVRRAGLGVVLFSDQLVQRWNVRGAVIQRVVPGSAAATAGLQAAGQDRRGRIRFGDIIIGVDGENVDTAADLANALDQREVGDEIELLVSREGDQRRVSIRLIELRN